MFKTKNIVIGVHSGRNVIVNKINRMRKNEKNYNIERIVSEIKDYARKNKGISDDMFEIIINKHKNLIYKYTPES